MFLGSLFGAWFLAVATRVVRICQKVQDSARADDLCGQSTYVLLVMGVSVWTGGQYGVQLSGPLPSFVDRVWLLGVNILISEVLFYHMHRLLHTKHLYRLVHKKHHHYKAPFALCAIYCHPFELVVGNLIPVTLGLVFTKAHIFFVFV